MEGADALGLIAEIGIAIAGFAGVVAALRAPGGRMVPFTAFRTGVLLATSAKAVLLALLPFALHFAGLESATIWALSSAAMTLLVTAVFIGLVHVRRSLGLLAEEHLPPGLRLFIAYNLTRIVSIVVLQLVNVALWRELWPFYVGLMATTGHCVLMFAYILFAPTRAEVPA